MPILSVKNLNTGYGDMPVLRDVSLDIEEGEIVALLGSNGAGKTTLMQTIVGILPPWTGEIVYQGENITQNTSDKIISKGISIVPEGRRLFAGMTVTENLEMGAFPHKKNVKAMLDRMFQIFPSLQRRRNHLAGDLSGGEQQMVAIGRALMNDPKIVLIDEFSLGLAPAVVDSLIGVIKDIHDLKVSILIVEQDVQLVLEFSDRAYVMETGHIPLSGNSKELLNHPRIREVYLGL